MTILLALLFLLAQAPTADYAWVNTPEGSSPTTPGGTDWTSLVDGNKVCKVNIQSGYVPIIFRGQPAKAFGTLLTLSVFFLGTEQTQKDLAEQTTFLFKGVPSQGDHQLFLKLCRPAVATIPTEVRILAPDYFKLADK